MRKALLIFFTLLLLINPTISQPTMQAVYVISETEQSDYKQLPEARYVSVLIDSSKQLTFEDVKLHPELFKPLTDYKNRVLSFSHHTWLHYRLSAETDLKKILFVGECSSVYAYLTDQSGQTRLSKTGFFIPRSERDIPELPDCIELKMKAGQVYDIYVRYAPQVRLPGVAKTYLVDTDFVWRHEMVKQIVIHAMFTGALLLMMLFYIVFFITSRDKTYLRYSFYIATILTLYIRPQLYFHDFSSLTSEYPEIVNTFLWLCGQLIIVFYALFMQSFLNTKETLPHLDNILKKYIFVRSLSAPILVTLSLFVTSFPLSQLAYFIDIGTMLYACIKVARSKIPIGKYLVIGTTFFSLMSLIGISTMMYWLFVGGIEHLPPMYHTPDEFIMVGILGELVLFSMGMGIRSRYLSKEKKETQTRLIEQLKANEQLQIDINKKLEEKVNKRTSEIMRQNTELNLALQRNQLLASISQQFLTSDFESAVRYALKEICLINNLERSYLFFFTEDRQQMFCYATWNNPSVPRQMDMYDQLQPIHTLPVTTAKLLNGDIVNIVDVDEMEDGIDKQLLKTDYTKSIICVPIMAHNKSIGFIGFDNVNDTRVWSENEITTLRISTEIIGGSYVRLKAEEQIRKQHEEIVLQKNKIEESYRELQRTQSQLIQSEKMASLGLLTAGVAHEINNPINFVTANIEPLKTDIDELIELMHAYEKSLDNSALEPEQLLTLKQKIKPELLKAEITELVDGIAEGAIRTKEIVMGLRNFSRVDETELKLADIHEGIDSSLMLLQNNIRNKIQVIKQYGDIPKMYCYPGKLNQVFLNLLTNAIQAIDKDGIITITTGNDKEQVFISIKDNGKGMSEDTRKKIFDPFFTTKNVGEGTGLGLSISYGIIEKHKGHISVKSEPGKGSEFIITIPTTLTHE